MSISQTYRLAHRARAKLSTEAQRSDHNLRLLVGHANLLDSLMVEIADAEREQQSWFNQSVRGAAEQQQQQQQQQQEAYHPYHAQQHHHQQVVRFDDEGDDDWAVNDSDSDIDYLSDDDISDEDEEEEDDDNDDEDVEMADAVSVQRVEHHSHHHQLTRVPSRKRTPLPPFAAVAVTAEEEAAEEEAAEDEDLELSKVPSCSNPPELDHDADSSEDESMPPSPHQDALAFSPKNAAVADGDGAAQGGVDEDDDDDDVVVPSGDKAAAVLYADGGFLGSPARVPASLF
jgi:hypothetical protein